MDFVSYKVAVPGSLMLFGEHAVLHHKQAVVTAIDRYIEVKLIPGLNNEIKIIAKGFGNYSTSLDKFKVNKKHEYVLTAIKQHLSKIKKGFVLEIVSDLPTDVGFGSSAAITVATLGVLSLWLEGRKLDLMKIYKRGVKVVRLVQGFGSGGDVGASIFGGIIAYRTKPLLIKRLGFSLPLVAVYSGNKVTTKKVVAQIERSRKKFPNVYSKLYSAIDSCAKEAIKTIRKKNWRKLGQLMNIHQGLHDSLGVGGKVLSEINFSLLAKTGIYGSKISGSGLGDCVIGLGKIKKNNFPENKEQKKIGVKQFDIKVSKKGLHVIARTVSVASGTKQSRK